MGGWVFVGVLGVSLQVPETHTMFLPQVVPARAGWAPLVMYPLVQLKYSQMLWRRGGQHH